MSSLCSTDFLFDRQGFIMHDSGADPGFFVGGGANPPGGGANIQIFQIFLKKTA